MDRIGHLCYSALNQKHGKAIKVQQTMQTNSKQLLLIGKQWPLDKSDCFVRFETTEVWKLVTSYYEMQLELVGYLYSSLHLAVTEMAQCTVFE